jgi:uncharacterized protein
VTEFLIIFVAGVWAGSINAVVGSGTLVTFPTLLFLGYPPLVANMSNNVGLVAGGITGTFGYRRELAAHRRLIKRLVPTVALGALTGAVLLLVLPSSVFNAVVPVLIGLGMVMVLLGPAVQRRAAKRGRDPAATTTGLAAGVGLQAGMFLAGAYGGYFGAAQGVIQIGLIGMFLAVSIQEANAIKNVLTTLANAIAAVTFVIAAGDLIDWSVAATIAAGAFVGGYLGATYGRLLPRNVLRAAVVTVGLIAIAHLVVFE